MGALLNKTSDILKIDIDDSGIQNEGQQFELKLNQAMENSQDLADYVSKLEEAEVSIEDNFSEDNLVQQIEDFLNEERDL
jgi:RNA polymerase-binding transcription factor DksA